ncbi:MAG: sodium:solute symporter family transporter [Bacteriovoracaceae bacterium]
MNTYTICLIGFLYYLLIFFISKFAGRKSEDNEYLKTTAPAWLVTIGIVGDSLSGVTYLSVPGTVEQKSFSYLAICLGYLVGYVIIAYVFLPIYHKKNLVSIYEWIGSELGEMAQKTSSLLFVFGRLFGSAARLCLTAGVLHLFVFKAMNLGNSFSIIAVTIGISLYTLKSGIKSLIVTDTVQSIFLVLGVLVTTVGLYYFLQSQNTSPQFFRPIVVGNDGEAWMTFWKSFFSGILITLSMTGLDQNIMQKTFSVKSLKSLQINFVRLGFIVLLVNFIVLLEGSLLTQSLDFFPHLKTQPNDQKLIYFVLNHQHFIFQLFFLLGLTAATLNSADSVITTVTSSIKVDLVKSNAVKLSHIHWIVTALLAGTALFLNAFSEGSAIDLVLKSAGWTYGPLLGYFLIAALKLKSNSYSLILALITSVIVTFLIHLNYDLKAEVIIVLSMFILLFNRLYLFCHCLLRS